MRVIRSVSMDSYAWMDGGQHRLEWTRTVRRQSLLMRVGWTLQCGVSTPDHVLWGNAILSDQRSASGIYTGCVF